MEPLQPKWWEAREEGTKPFLFTVGRYAYDLADLSPTQRTKFDEIVTKACLRATKRYQKELELTRRLSAQLEKEIALTWNLARLLVTT